VIDTFSRIRSAIVADPDNAWATQRGWDPLYTAGPEARLVIVGQAPGMRAQVSGIPWNDASGVTLRNWLGVSDGEFYESGTISLLPMDFYYRDGGVAVICRRAGDSPRHGTPSSLP
jgi:uracil-DNA glycosylase